MRYTAADRASRSERSDKAYAIAGLAGLALAMGVGRFALTPIFPLMQSEASLSVADGAWLAAANYLGYLVGALAAFGVNRRVSMFIRAALVVNAAATLGIGLTHAFPVWLAWRFIAGVASAFLLVFISATCVERLAPRGRPMLIAAVFSGVGAGIFGVGVLVFALAYSAVDSSGIWLALGALSVVLTMFVWPVFRERSDAHLGAPAMQRIAQRRLAWWPVIASYGLLGFGYIVPATFLPIMAKSVVGDGWTFGLTWPAFGFAAFVSTFVGTYASRRASGLGVWRTSQSVMALGVALPALLSGLVPIIAAAICVGGTFMVITMSAMQTATQLGTAYPKRLMAAMTAAFAAGQLAGPVAVSWSIEPGAGFSKLLLTAAASLLLGALLLPRGRTVEQHAHVDPLTRKA
ncbi:MAG: YbfB/YjiJ family MFS transporter [Burkholderiales bacterium]